MMVMEEGEVERKEDEEFCSFRFIIFLKREFE